MLATTSSGERELQKVPVEVPQRGPVLPSAQCRVTEQLPRAGDLPQSAAPAGIREGEVEQLERAIECVGHEPLVLAAPAAHSSHFGPDVAELLGKRQPTPPSRGQLLVSVGRLCHVPMSLVTICCRMDAAWVLDDTPGTTENIANSARLKTTSFVSLLTRSLLLTATSKMFQFVMFVVGPPVPQMKLT